MVLVVVEAASFDHGCGGCRLVIFVVVGEEKMSVGGKRERSIFYFILLGILYSFIGLYVKIKSKM